MGLNRIIDRSVNSEVPTQVPLRQLKQSVSTTPTFVPHVVAALDDITRPTGRDTEVVSPLVEDESTEKVDRYKLPEIPQLIVKQCEVNKLKKSEFEYFIKLFEDGKKTAVDDPIAQLNSWQGRMSRGQTLSALKEIAKLQKNALDDADIELIFQNSELLQKRPDAVDSIIKGASEMKDVTGEAVTIYPIQILAGGGMGVVTECCVRKGDQLVIAAVKVPHEVKLPDEHAPEYADISYRVHHMITAYTLEANFANEHLRNPPCGVIRCLGVTVAASGQLPLIIYEKVVDSMGKSCSAETLLLNKAILPSYKADFLAKAAIALGNWHDAGFAHLDIKPQNIMVGEGETAVLIDAGGSMKRDAAHSFVQSTNSKKSLYKDVRLEDGSMHVYPIPVTEYYFDGDELEKMLEHNKDLAQVDRFSFAVTLVVTLQNMQILPGTKPVFTENLFDEVQCAELMEALPVNERRYVLQLIRHLLMDLVYSSSSQAKTLHDIANDIRLLANVFRQKLDKHYYHRNIVNP